MSVLEQIFLTGITIIRVSDLKIKNERNRHLSYCMICRQRAFASKEGTICGLTKLKANFEGDCSTFEFDVDAAYDKQKALVKHLNVRYVDQDFISRLLWPKKYSNEADPSLKRRLSASEANLEFRNPYSFGQVGVVLIIGIVLTGLAYKLKLPDDRPYLAIFVGVVTVTVIILQLLYLLFVLDVQGVKVGGTDDTGFYYGKHYFYWNEIMTAGIRKESRDKHETVFLIVGTITKGIRELKMTSGERDADRLLAVIQSKQNPVWRMMEEPINLENDFQF